MAFGALALLAVLAAAGLAALLSATLIRWRVRQAARFTRAGGAPVVVRRSLRRQGGKALLLVGALALFGVAVARPQLGSQSTLLRQQGVAVVLAIDVSLSMGAMDRAPSRLALVRAEVDALLDRRLGDRVGLVIFAGTAFPRFPLTRDLAAARQIVDALRPGPTLVQPGTDLAAAIAAAQSLLARSDAATHVIILISDGEQLQGAALPAAARAAAAGTRIFTAAVGTEAGATVPIRDDRTGDPAIKIDAASGAAVITRLDADLLQGIAQAGGGRFVRLDWPGDLSALAADLAALEATDFAVQREQTPRERFQFVVALALALLAVEPLIAEARRAGRRRIRRGVRVVALVTVVLLLTLLASACATSAFSRNEAATRDYDAGRYRAALDGYRAAQADVLDDLRLALNAGRALHALGEYARAATETARAITGGDAALGAQAYYNLGNHRLALGDLVGAHNAYIEALLRDPADRDAKFNLELITQRLDARPSPPGRPSPGDADAGGDGTDGSGEGEGDSTDRDAGQDGTTPSIGSPGGPPGGEQPPGRLGHADDADESAAAVARAGAARTLEAALAALDRDAPTPEQALAVLDALREDRAASRLGGGERLQPLAGERDW